MKVYVATMELESYTSQTTSYSPTLLNEIEAS